MKEAYKKAQVLIEALPYFQEFDEKVVVVKLGGNAMHESSLFEDTIRDIVFMEQVGICPVLVHGGGPHISEKMKEADMQSHFVDGLRVTDKPTLDIVDTVLQSINAEIAETINKKGGKAVSLHGAKDDLFLASKKDLPGKPDVDLGFVGTMEDVNPQKVIELVKQGVVPVISPLAKCKDGQFYNVNADSAAAKLAEKIKAEKLVMMSNVPGLLRDPNDAESLFSNLSVSQVNELIKDGIIDGGMLPKVESILHALEVGVNKVHIIDGRRHHSLLLEIFTPHGVGTLFFNDEVV